MKIFLILFCWFGCVVGSQVPQVFFQEALPHEVSEIQHKMAVFYGQELFDAKVFENRNKAMQAAIDECSVKNDDIVIYYNFCSKESASKYGYLVYSIKKDKGIAYLEALYLEQRYRGQGLGKQIMQNFEAELKGKNIDSVQLYVFAHNQPAIKLYKKMGYIVENTYSIDSDLIGYQMKKEIH